MTQRSVVIVSPHFPPSAMAAAHRARHLAKHLPSHGWRPIVATVDPRCSADPRDAALAGLLPPGLDEVRVKALPASLLRKVGIGDLGLRAYPYLAGALDGLLARGKPSLLFITGFPFYPMLLARRLKRRHGVKVVLDFQDPWVSAYGATRPRWSKEGIAHRLAVALEPKAVAAADFITSVSDHQNEDMAARYPWFDAARMASVPIGGDPADFAALHGRPKSSDAILDPAFINISYVGAYWPRAEPTVRALLRAMALLRNREPALAQKLRFNFVGTGEAPLSPLIAQEGVTDMVCEHPRRVPFLEALDIMANSQGLLLFGSDEPHYTASKIYPMLMAARPYLSLLHRGSSANAVLAAAGGGANFTFDTPQSLAALVPALADGLRMLAARPQNLGQVDPVAYAPYTANAVAGRFAAIFEKLA